MTNTPNPFLSDITTYRRVTLVNRLNCYTCATATLNAWCWEYQNGNPAFSSAACDDLYDDILTELWSRRDSGAGAFQKTGGQ